jgi:branched-subunit amino acid permease
MKRHEFDPVSAVFGVLFAGSALAVTLADDRVFDIGGRWVWPLLLVAAGVMLVASGAGRRDRD